jgi:hypothetical protein
VGTAWARFLVGIGPLSWLRGNFGAIKKAILDQLVNG